MKLGNKGFGMRDFIIYSCILILILLFVAYSINNLYKGIESSKSNNQSSREPIIVTPPEEEKPPVETEKPRVIDYDYYHNLEAKLKDASTLYLRNYPTQIADGAIFNIGLDDLVGLNYLDSFKVKGSTEKCTGYSNVYLKEGDTTYTIDSYINCGEYMTEGYR